MTRRSIRSTLLFATVVASLAPPARAQVNVAITSDNAYGLGYGNAKGVFPTFYGPVVESVNAGAIYGCVGGAETYSYNVTASGLYFYIVAWSDDSSKQGTLGQFTYASNPTIYTGVDPSPGAWQVFATGLDYDVPTGGPPVLGGVTAINSQIAIANAGTGAATSSVTWVGLTGGSAGNLAFGEDNSNAAGIFPILCSIDPGAKWMWFDVYSGTGGSPFNTNPPGGKGQKEYLIFRISLSELPGYPWVDIGPAINPPTGPYLTGSGTLVAGAPVALDLIDAQPNSLALLAASTTMTPTPVLCGTLLPFPLMFSAMVSTDAAGAVSLGAPWPGGVPPQTFFFFQCLAADPASPCGVRFSNTVRALTP